MHSSGLHKTFQPSLSISEVVFSSGYFPKAQSVFRLCKQQHFCLFVWGKQGLRWLKGQLRWARLGTSLLWWHCGFATGTSQMKELCVLINTALCNVHCGHVYWPCEWEYKACALPIIDFFVQWSALPSTPTTRPSVAISRLVTVHHADSANLCTAEFLCKTRFMVTAFIFNEPFPKISTACFDFQE